MMTATEMASRTLKRVAEGDSLRKIAGDIGLSYTTLFTAYTRCQCDRRWSRAPIVALAKSLRVLHAVEESEATHRKRTSSAASKHPRAKRRDETTARQAAYADFKQQEAEETKWSSRPKGVPVDMLAYARALKRLRGERTRPKPKRQVRAQHVTMGSSVANHERRSPGQSSKAYLMRYSVSFQ